MKWLKIALWISFFWLLMVGIYTLQMWPNIPRSLIGWLIFALVIPPLSAAAEYGFARLFSAENGRRISSKSFSWVRLLILLPVMLLIVAGATLLPHLLRDL